MNGREMEEYALTNIAAELGYLSYLPRKDLQAIRNHVDLNLHAHLSKLRKHRGVTPSPDLEAVTIRTLNGLALIWEDNPPEWGIPSMQRDHTENLKLLRWAREQCLAKPELKCRSRK